MEPVWKLCLKSMREEGAAGFIRRFVSWTEGYVVWKRRIINKWMLDHADWY